MKVLIFIVTLSSITAKTIRLIDIQTGNPIENVNVFVADNGTTTDKYGFCNLGIFNKTDYITFSMIGYNTVILPSIEISKVVYLQNESIPLPLVNVVSVLNSNLQILLFRTRSISIIKINPSNQICNLPVKNCYQ